MLAVHGSLLVNFLFKDIDVVRQSKLLGPAGPVHSSILLRPISTRLCRLPQQTQLRAQGMAWYMWKCAHALGALSSKLSQILGNGGSEQSGSW